MTIASTIEAMRLRAMAWSREQREKAAERKAAIIPDPPGVTVMAWQVKSAKALSWIAAGTAAFFLLSFCIGIAGDQSNTLHVTHAGTWIGDLQFFVPLVIGFLAIAVGIPYLAKSAIPIFVAFNWREHFWPKFWMLFLTIAASFVIIAGSFSVQGGAIIEHGRSNAVAVEQVGQQHAALQAQIDAENEALRDMSNNSNAYMAQAANVGADEWARTYITQARTTHDARLPMIERALGAARAADARRAHLVTLRASLATSATIASVEATPTTAGTSWIAGTIDFIRGAWALMLSVLNDIVCLLMGWIALRLEQTRNRQLNTAGVEGSGWADEAHRIEDFSDEAKLQVDPAGMRPARQSYIDPESGEEYDTTVVRAFKRRVPKKGVKTKVTIQPATPPDETGAPTGTGDERSARAAPIEKDGERQDGDVSAYSTNQDAEEKSEASEGFGVHPLPPPTDETQEPSPDATAEPDGVHGDEPQAAVEAAPDAIPELTDEQLLAVTALEQTPEADADSDEAQAEADAEEDGGGVEHVETPVAEEPTGLMSPSEAAAIRRRIYEEEMA